MSEKIKTKRILWCPQSKPSLLQLQKLAFKDIRKRSEYNCNWVSEVVLLEEENKTLFDKIINSENNNNIHSLAKEFMDFIVLYDAIVLPINNPEFIYIFASKMAIHQAKKLVFIAIKNSDCEFREINNGREYKCEHTNIHSYSNEFIKCYDCGFMLSTTSYFKLMNYITIKSTEEIIKLQLAEAKHIVNTLIN